MLEKNDNLERNWDKFTVLGYVLSESKADTDYLSRAFKYWRLYKLFLTILIIKIKKMLPTEKNS